MEVRDGLGVGHAHHGGFDALREFVDGLREEALVFDEVTPNRRGRVVEFAKDVVAAAFEGHCERSTVDEGEGEC